MSVLQGGGKVEVYPKSVDCHRPSLNLAFLNFDIFQNKLGLRDVCVFSSPNAQVTRIKGSFSYNLCICADLGA